MTPRVSQFFEGVGFVVGAVFAERFGSRVEKIKAPAVDVVLEIVATPEVVERMAGAGVVASVGREEKPDFGGLFFVGLVGEVVAERVDGVAKRVAERRASLRAI